MDIVGACEDQSSDQLPAWTSNRFVVFLERDPAGLPPHLVLLEGGSSALRGERCRALQAKSGHVDPGMPYKASFSQFSNRQTGPTPGISDPWDGSAAGLRLRLKRFRNCC